MAEYKLGNYLITYDSNIKTVTFDCEWYYGIIFFINNEKHELIHNYALGDRILISKCEGWLQDIPFKPSTFYLLPAGIKAKEM